MTKLGEILVARGSLTLDELRSALDACRRGGGRLGTWVVRLGYTTERALVTALSEQTGCPPATALDLTSASPDVRGLIDESFARRHSVVAFARQGRNLAVAMARPNDLVLVDELASMTGLAIRPHVAAEAAFSAAFALPAATDASAGNDGPPARPGRERRPDWNAFWSRGHGAHELFAALGGQRATPPPAAWSSFPTLTPLARGASPGNPAPAGRLSEALHTASHRDHVAAAVLDAVAGLADRAALFSIHQKKVTGWAWRGEGVVPEDFQNFILPLDRPSVLLDIAQGGRLHRGALQSLEGNVPLAEALGTPPPVEILVVPVKVRGRVAAFLWLDSPGRPAASIPAGPVEEAARLAGLALEILVLRQKIKPASHLTEWAAAD